MKRQAALEVLEDDVDRRALAVGLGRDLRRVLADRGVVGVGGALEVAFLEVLVALAQVVLGLRVRGGDPPRDRGGAAQGSGDQHSSDAGSVGTHAASDDR
jgi:hypothetical protein